MTVTGFLSVSPVIEDSMAEEVASAIEALEEYEVTYEMSPMGTTIEANDIDELFDAVKAAHRAVSADRVSTLIKIDDKRTSSSPAAAKVESVESVLGRPARRE